MAARIRKGDKVVVLTGRDKGRTVRASAEDRRTDPQALGKRYQLTAALPPSAINHVRHIPGVQNVAPRYEERALVRGINLVKRHQKQSAQHEGGIISKESPVHLSNLALADPKDGKPTRIGFKFVGAGENRRKVRVAKRSGVELDG